MLNISSVQNAERMELVLLLVLLLVDKQFNFVQFSTLAQAFALTTLNAYMQCIQ